MDQFGTPPYSPSTSPASSIPSSAGRGSSASAATSPSDSNSKQASWPATWPVDALQSESIQLVPLQPIHAVGLDRLAVLPFNARMFPLVYNEPYTSTARLVELFSIHRQDPTVVGGAFTIIHKPTGRKAGWIVLKPFNDAADPISCVLFLDESERALRASETMWVVCRHVLEYLGHDVMDWRTGLLTEDASQYTAMLGFSLIGVLRREMLDPKRSLDSDYHRLHARDWPAVKAAFHAWVGVESTAGGDD